MPQDTSTIVSKVWNYPPTLCDLRRIGAHLLKNAGVGYGLPVGRRTQTGDYIEQITYLLFDSVLRPSGFAQTFSLPLSASLRLKLAGEHEELGFDSSRLNPYDLQRVSPSCLTN